MIRTVTRDGAVEWLADRMLFVTKDLAAVRCPQHTRIFTALDFWYGVSRVFGCSTILYKTYSIPSVFLAENQGYVIF